MSTSKKSSQPATPDFAKDWVNRVDTWYGSAYCAAVTIKGWIRLFQISERHFVRDIFTHKDPGGVSVAMSPDDKFCFAGSYYAWGLACFDVRTGATVWKRDDLRRFYGLTYSSGLDSLFAFFDGKSAMRIDPRTGETLETFRGMNFVDASPLDNSILFGDGKSFHFRDSAGKRIWSVPRESFGVLEAAWSPETVAISEVGSARADGSKAGIRCYSTHGELLWRYQGKNTHVSPLMYDPRHRAYVGVDFTAGTGDRLLLRWDVLTGRLMHEEIIPYTLHGELCQQGSLMFLLDRKTYELSLMPVAP